MEVSVTFVHQNHTVLHLKGKFTKFRNWFILNRKKKSIQSKRLLERGGNMNVNAPLLPSEIPALSTLLGADHSSNWLAHHLLLCGNTDLSIPTSSCFLGVIRKKAS